MIFLKFLFDMLVLIILVILVVNICGYIIDIVHLLWIWIIEFPYYSIKYNSWNKGFKIAKNKTL